MTGTEETGIAQTDERALEEEEKARRILHTKLLFWRVCPLRACKRARGCRGDVNACWRLWRPAIPEEVMVKLRAIISARVAGLSVEESRRAADARWAEVKSTLAQIEDEEARRAAKAPPLPPTRNLPSPAPRVRLT